MITAEREWDKALEELERASTEDFEGAANLLERRSRAIQSIVELCGTASAPTEDVFRRIQAVLEAGDLLIRRLTIEKHILRGEANRWNQIRRGLSSGISTDPARVDFSG